MLYVIGIGSNVAPTANVPAALGALEAAFGGLLLSRVGVTAPVGVEGGEAFLNAAAVLRTDAPPPVVKEAFNAIERALGRDRDDPARSRKSRPMDLDILFTLPDAPARVPPEDLPPEPYVRPFVIDLAHCLDPAFIEPPPPVRTVRLTVGDRAVGPRPCTLGRLPLSLPEIA